MAPDARRSASAALRVLIVEDDGALGAMLQLILEHDQFDVAPPVRSGRGALDAIARNAHDVAIVDLELPDMDGLELLADLRRRVPLMRLVVCSAHPTDSVQMQQARALADGVIGKLDLTRTGVLVREVCERSETAVSRASLDEQLEAIWTRSVPDTVRRLEQVADVLLAIQRGDDDPVTRADAIGNAHQVRGLAATYGRTNLVDLACTADHLLRTPRPDDEQVHRFVQSVRRCSRAAAAHRDVAAT